MDLSTGVHLIAFADSRMAAATKRFNRQALKSGFFETVSVFSESSHLLSDWITECDKRIGLGKGFGYWTWKPVLLQGIFDGLRQGDILIYSDIGNFVNHRGRKRFQEYVEMLRSGRASLIAFWQDRTAHGARIEEAWTKEDAFTFFSLGVNHPQRKTPQFCANLLIFLVNDTSGSVIADWADLAKNETWLFTDECAAPNQPQFLDHRHDQSILSLILKRHGVSPLSAGELEAQELHPGDVPNWKTQRTFPFQARRAKRRQYIETFSGLFFRFAGFMGWSRAATDGFVGRIRKFSESRKG